MAVAVVAAFGIAATVVGPLTIATPVLAQGNMTGNMTGGNVTGGNMTGTSGSISSLLV